MGEQLHQVGYLQELIERSPAATLAAILALLLLSVVTLWLRAVVRVERLQRAHAKATTALQEDHNARVDSIRMAELERAVKLEHLVQGVLRMVEVGTIDVVRGRRRKKPTTNPGLALEPEAEAPTLTLGVDEDE